MIRLLLDINIIVDVLFERTPHLDSSLKLWRFVEQRQAEGWLAAHAVTTLHYLVRQQIGAPAAMRTLADIIPLFQVAPVDGGIIAEALTLNWPDFEDAVTALAAKRAECVAVITRDARGFRKSEIPILTPELACGLIEDHL